MTDKGKLILASGSPARATLLTQAGLVFDTQPADLDESAIINELSTKIPPADLAAVLAEKKAQHIAAKNTRDFVIGADQMLVADGRIFTKSGSLTEAKKTLGALSGRTHRLISAVCVVSGKDVLWHKTDIARLTMKELTEEQIDRYLAVVGKEALQAVGCYQLEGPGIWLFEKIEGSYFTILGLPLLPLLQFLDMTGRGPLQG